jgi:gluconokinase
MYVSLKDWVFWQLTGKLWTDVGLASTTGLVDIHAFRWDDTALEYARVSPTNLPQLKAPTDTSMLAAEVAQDVGLPSIPVILGGSDGALANLGSSAGLPQRAAVTVGTSGAVRLLSTTPLLDDAAKARTWCYVLTEDRYVAGGAINNGGIALQYLRDKLFPECSTTQLISEAADVDLHARRPLVLPYLSGERSPHWRSDATATIHGLTLEQGRGALVRSVLEAVCFCLADIWQILRPQTDTDTVYLSGGICKSHFWSQLLADVLGVDIVMVDAADASAVGAAMLGHQALATADLTRLSNALPVGERLSPNADAYGYYIERLSAFRDLFEQLYKDSN